MSQTKTPEQTRLLQILNRQHCLIYSGKKKKTNKKHKTQQHLYVGTSRLKDLGSNMGSPTVFPIQQKPIYLALNHLCYCVFPLGTRSLYSGLEFIVQTMLASNSELFLLHLPCSSRHNDMYYHAQLCIIYFLSYSSS